MVWSGKQNAAATLQRHRLTGGLHRRKGCSWPGDFNPTVPAGCFSPESNGGLTSQACCDISRAEGVDSTFSFYLLDSALVYSSNGVYILDCWILSPFPSTKTFNLSFLVKWWFSNTGRSQASFVSMDFPSFCIHLTLLFCHFSFFYFTSLQYFFSSFSYFFSSERHWPISLGRE
jgi:hypothetical protein